MLFSYFFFFFNDTATTEIYTLSLHDALPISFSRRHAHLRAQLGVVEQPDQGCTHLVDRCRAVDHDPRDAVDDCVGGARSEEHTSELQSRQYLVCRLLLEKKKNITQMTLVLCI